jgi:hypothetical protein
VSYGRAGYLGRFRVPAGLTLARGEAVVVRTPRGLELGELLDPHNQTPADWPMGELLRRADDADHARAAEQSVLAGRGIDEASRQAERLGLPLTILDAEMPLDGEQLILHVVRWGDTSADDLCLALEDAFGLHVSLLDLSQPPAPAAASGCGSCGTSGGCSSCGTGGGCSSGSCSRGSVRSAEELAAYFASLRAQMELDTLRRTPLN